MKSGAILAASQNGRFRLSEGMLGVQQTALRGLTTQLPAAEGSAEVNPQSAVGKPGLPIIKVPNCLGLGIFPDSGMTSEKSKKNHSCFEAKQFETGH
jgi:hypothetical protein